MIDNHLILVAGSGKSRELAQEIHNLLASVYKLDKVQLVLSRSYNELSTEEKQNKDHKRQLIIDRFPDGETRVECGRELLSSFKDSHLIFVDYLFEPNSGFTINDKKAEVRAFGELLRHTTVRKLTIAFPYPVYVRAHSTEKYEKIGLLQSNTLQRLAKDLYNVKEEWPNKVAKVELVTIDPHNPKLWIYCDLFGLEHKDMTPFQRDIDYTHLGLNPKDKEHQQELMRLRPFYSYYLQNQDKYQDLIIIAADDGSEGRAKKFALDLELGFERVCVIDKQRVDASKVVINGIKQYSSIQKEHLVGRTCIITDDMVSSGGTANEVAKFLKNECGAGKVDLWVSHNVCTEPAKITATLIDEVVALDTVPQETPKIITLEGSAPLLAACIYKSYMSELSKNIYL